MTKSEQRPPLAAARRVRAVEPSGIRRFFELATEQDDVISLGVGEPDFSAPWRARQAGMRSLERGQTSYTANRGQRELRAAIAEHVRRYDHDYDPETEVLVTTGVSEGFDAAIRALVDPGDVVAIAQPSYVSYEPAVQFAGAEPLPVPMSVEDGFQLTPAALDAAGADEAEALVLCSPNNPTGTVLSADALEAIAAFAVEHDLTVFADEVYAALTYDGEHTSIATLPGMRERTVVFNGFSKAFAMTGLRLGYVLAPPQAIDAINRIHQYAMLSAPTTAQHAALEALRACADDVAEMVEQYDRRRRYVHARFEEMGLDCVRPAGAFYAFPAVPDGDDQGFAEGLLEAQSVAAVPGRVFGAGGTGHLRVSYATGMAELREAMARIETYLGDQA